MMMNYWLFKTEADEYSLHDLAQEKQGYGVWNGIRNYQARNFIRDNVKQGDQVLIYHSACSEPAIVGLAEVVREAYVDVAQFASHSPYFDSKASEENPRWFCLDIAYRQTFPRSVRLQAIKQDKQLADMQLLKQPRLSISSVSAAEFNHILGLAKATA